MKANLFILFLVIAHSTFAQCVNCKSLKEALIEPWKVRTIIYNGSINEPLDSIPVSIGKCKNLVTLYLSDNLFKTIPKEIGNLANLTELSFAGCKLESLPEEIFTLVNLKNVYLNNNNFSEKYLEEIKNKFSKQLPATKVSFD